MNIPKYGTGGVVTSPHMEVVGDVPEAIIPLHKLNDIITGTALMILPSMTGSDGSAPGGQEVTVNQMVAIYQPVKSPSETARAIKTQADCIN